ncbi:MAG TPA: endonuclease III domain-containing protein [Dehalococcoidia bacterium]|nr:endonuclease III domain-containing protein [Dehalococcoidia bacterium]
MPEPVSLTGRRLTTIFDRLLDHYGPQDWWPGDSDLEIIVGAILTQSAAWRNVEKAINALKIRGLLEIDALRSIDQGKLAQLIRPSGYFNAKAAKIKAFIAMLDEHYNGRLGMLLSEPLDAMRDRLLATPGIGSETADAIVLYAGGLPTFVVDAYARRILRRIGFGPAEDGYEDWRAFLMEALPPDAALFNEYHALLVAHGKALCGKHRIRCEACPLLDLCATGQDSVTSSQSSGRTGIVQPSGGRQSRQAGSKSGSPARAASTARSPSARNSPSRLAGNMPRRIASPSSSSSFQRKVDRSADSSTSSS